MTHFLRHFKSSTERDTGGRIFSSFLSQVSEITLDRVLYLLYLMRSCEIPKTIRAYGTEGVDMRLRSRTSLRSLVLRRLHNRASASMKLELRTSFTTAR